MKLLRRLLAILLVLLILVGLYVTVKGLSGYDPLKLDPDKVSPLLSGRALELFENLQDRLSDRTLVPGPTPVKKPILVTIGLIADSHSDSQNLQKAMAQLKAKQVSYVLALGDYTTVGTVAELKEAKRVIDAADIPYSAVPGDHDFWDNKNKGEVATQNFQAIFGDPYQGIRIKNIPFVLINNANNDSGISDEQMTWIKSILAQEKTGRERCATASEANKPVGCGLPLFAIVHKPLYHPTTSHIMGQSEKAVDDQRKELLGLLKQAGVSEVISGDLHFFSRFAEPSTDLKMTTVGAVVDARNPQRPRYAILTVYTDGSYDITDVEIE